jgi:hypothetical protein
MTTVAAVLFMLTSISLSMISRQTTESGQSVLETTTQPAEAEPAAEKPASQTDQAIPTPEQIRKIQEEYEGQQEPQQGTPATESPAENTDSGQAP